MCFLRGVSVAPRHTPQKADYMLPLWLFWVACFCHMFISSKPHDEMNNLTLTAAENLGNVSNQSIN